MSPSPQELPGADPSMERILRERIFQKRAASAMYARSTEQRIVLLNTLSIVFGALATVLAAAGVALTADLGSTWRYICVGASICSAISTVCISLIRVSASSEAIEKAHRVDTKLETLELQLDLKQISPSQGLETYLQVVADMPGPGILSQPFPLSPRPAQAQTKAQAH